MDMADEIKVATSSVSIFDSIKTYRSDSVPAANKAIPDPRPLCTASSPGVVDLCDLPDRPTADPLIPASRSKRKRTAEAAASGNPTLHYPQLHGETERLGPSGRTPLWYAAENGHEAVVKLLLENGADADAKSNSGRTPLWYAAKNGHEAVVKLLLEKGADADAKSNSGRTLLSYAAENGHEAVVKLLLENGADADAKSNSGRTPLWYAAKNGHEAVVKQLLEKGTNADAKDDFGWTPLSYAAKNGHEAVVKLLLEKGADADAEDDFGRTPLSYAAEHGYEAVVKRLREKGANADAKSNSGRTLLWYATKNGREAIVKQLLEKGADADAKDDFGRTLLSYAAENGHEAIVKRLLEKGADADAEDDFGRTPLSYAAENGHEAVVRVPLDAGKVVANSKDTEYGQAMLRKPRIRGLDASFQTVNPQKYRTFFKKGRVLKILWAEPAPPDQESRDNTFTIPEWSEPAFAKIRWFIVIQTWKSHCFAVAVHTYGKRGVTKAVGNADDHAALVIKGQDQVLLPGETLKRRHLQLILESKTDQPDSTSRVDFSKFYTIEYNLKVHTVGRIAPEDVYLLREYVLQSLRKEHRVL